MHFIGVSFILPAKQKRKTLYANRWLAALLAGGLLTACGSTAPGVRATSSATPSSPPLETVRPSLHNLEDSLVLDMLLGYQEVTSGKSDRETLRRARSAQNQLDYMLRHGGVKDHGGEGRIYEIPAGEKATLGELTSQLSRELLRAPTSEIEVQRALEIKRHRMNLSFLAEDAEWVLALNAALTGPLPEEDKRNLNRLHEAYGNRAPHTVIASQVTALMKSVRDDRLRKELKKLANRSWEREKRAKEPGESSVVPPVHTPAPLPDFDTPLPSAHTGLNAVSGSPVPTGNSTDTASAPTDLLTTPDQFCEERRTEAAETFASARASTGENRKALLRRSLATLDECLTRYPDSQGAEKARSNRARVEIELKQEKDLKAK